MRVLYLSAWYPTERDQMSGLFVRKHKEAVERQGVDVRVAYNEEKSAFRSLWLLWCEIKQWMNKGWTPDLVQVNVLNKNVLIALFLYRFYHIPYVIVEHWTGYLLAVNDYKGFMHKRMAEMATRHAKFILPVSRDLAAAMQNRHLNGNYLVINNVVDDFFYEQQEAKPRTKKRLLHISCMDEPHKNVFGILRATRLLWEKRQDFELVIVGTGRDYAITTDYAQSLGILGNVVHFVGEQTPVQVCDWFYDSDAFVLFSNYENAPVVISESLAVGCPIISSDVGGIAEMVNEQCGVLIAPKDEQALLREMDCILDHYDQYNSEIIRSCGVQYSYQSVGQQLYAIYKRSTEK